MSMTSTGHPSTEIREAVAIRGVIVSRMTMVHRLQRRWRLARATVSPGAQVRTWWFIVGVDPLAVQRAADVIVARQAAPSVPFPAGNYQDELARPSTHRQTHTWGVEPVLYTLEAQDLGVSAKRLQRQWAQYGESGSDLVVADPVNSLRIPWLHAHFPARFVHATLPESDAVCWQRARSGLSTDLAQEHVHRIHSILMTDLAAVPHETLTPTMPAPPLTD